MTSPRVAVDAMGGDRAPEVPVAGAVRALREQGTPVLLVGDEARVRQELQRQGADGLLGDALQIRHAAEAVEMDEKPAQAARRKKHSSIRVALDLVKGGEAQAMVSAGNSGAVMATALVALGRIKGVLRPAIASKIPNVHGMVVILDLGANTEVDPPVLAQWALLGEAYAHLVHGKARPRIGLLSNGEEEGKGTDLTRGAHAILKQLPGVAYAGYAEGRDCAAGDFDVIVTDGFTGNVVLKTLEGAGKFISHFLRSEIEGGGIGYKVGYTFLRGVFDKLRRTADYREFGGAPLLGVNGVVIIAHGGSDEFALARAIHQGAHHVEVGLNAAIAKAVQEHSQLFGHRAHTPPELEKPAAS